MSKLEIRASWDVPVGTNRKLGDMSGDVKTFPVDLGMQEASVTIYWTGTPAGPIYIEVSSDHDPRDQSDYHNGHWDNINSQLDPVPTPPAGAGGQYNISMEPIRAKYVRVFFDRTSGAGSIAAVFTTARTAR